MALFSGVGWEKNDTFGRLACPALSEPHSLACRVPSAQLLAAIHLYGIGWDLEWKKNWLIESWMFGCFTASESARALFHCAYCVTGIRLQPWGMAIAIALQLQPRGSP